MTTVNGLQRTATTTPEGRSLTITGFVLAAVGLFFMGVIVCPIGAIVSGVAMAKGDRLGRWALVANIAALVLTFLVVGLAIGLGTRFDR